MTESPILDSSLAVLVFSPGDDPIACLNKAMALLIAVASLSTGYKSNATSSGGNNASGQARVVKCYNCQVEGHMARQCTQPKRPRTATWYKDKAMLVEAQEAGQILDEEQLAFLTEDLDTYDFNCDDISNAKVVLMANISNYGSDIISEVPHSKTYLNDMENQSVHAMQDFEQTPVVDVIDNEITKKANKEKNNESVTVELERYKERVKTFEQRLNIDLSSRKKMIDSQMDDMIKEKLALKEQVESLEQNLSKQIKEKETASRLRPYHFTYPERELTMEEILHKFINEGKRVTTRGGKKTTQDVQKDDTNMNGEEPPKEARDKPVESNKVLIENQPQGTNVLDKLKEAEDLATYHLSRFESPHMEVLTMKESADEFLDEHLMLLKSKFKDDEPWYADFVNYIVGKEPYAFKLCVDNIMRRCVAGSETLEILAHCHSGPTGGHHSANVTAKKVCEAGFYWPSVFKDANEYVRRCDACKRSGYISSRNEMPQNNVQVCEVFDVWGIDFMGPFYNTLCFQVIDDVDKSVMYLLYCMHLL
ncbi:putative ribonuclease H-like domain-containing protein [Tanacetum coccineum]